MVLCPPPPPTKLEVLKQFDSFKIQIKGTSTITSWAEQVQTGNINIPTLIAILEDTHYVNSDNVYTEESCLSDYEGPLECELGLLTTILPHLTYTSAEGQMLTGFFLRKLTHPYNRRDKNYSLYYRYSLIASSIIPSNTAGRDILDGLIRVVKGEFGSKPETHVWSARTLANVPYFSPAQQRKVIKELSSIIQNYSYTLKDTYDDKNALGYFTKNEHIAQKVFAAKVNFFAKNAEHSIMRSMLTSAVFVEEGRAFYLQNDLPGMDGKNFASTDNGNRHNISFNLIKTLFKAYVLSGHPEEMNNFIIKYGRLNTSKTGFDNYLLFAMYGMDEAFSYNDSKHIDGWLDQYNIFLSQIASNIWATAPAAIVLTTIQGGAEVSAEWIGITKLFKYGGKFFGAVGKAGMGAFLRFMPKQYFTTGAVLALGKAASKKLIMTAPKKALNKAVRILMLASPLALTGDENNSITQTEARNITMNKEEVKKLME